MFKPFGLFGIAVLVAAVATGCAAPTPQQGLVTGSALTIGEAGLLTNLNPGVYSTPAGEQAAADLAQLTRPQFYLHDAAGNLNPNPDFGTVTRASDGTVTYKLSGKAKWSDGEAVNAADLAVSWLAATDAQLPGYSSYLRRTSLALSDKLEILPDGVRVHFTCPVPDWQTALPVTVPAHLLGKLALPSANLSNSAAEKLITDEIGNNDTGVNSGLLASAFTSAFATTTNGTASVSADTQLLISAGAYSIEGATANKVVLVANKDFTAGPKATVARVVLVNFSTGDELAAAIQSKSVDLAAPEATTAYDLAKLANLAKGAGYSTQAGKSGRNEVILLNHSSGSAFDPATYGKNADQLKAALEGAFKFMPRSGVWNVLAGTAGLTKSNSLLFGTSNQSYSNSVAHNGTDAYLFQDAEKSVELWQAAKFQHTIPLRVLFDSNSPRGQLEFTQLSRLGKLGGFNVQNVSTDNPDSVLSTGQWDVYITNLGQLSTDNSALSTTVGALTGFQNTDVDKVVSAVAAGKTLTQNAASASLLDKLLTANYFGLPLFDLDRMVVWDAILQNFKPNPGNSSVTWGYSNWVVSPKGK